MNWLNVTVDVACTALVAIVLVDVLITILSVRGGGPLTRRWTNVVWRCSLKVHYRVKSDTFLACIPTLLLAGIFVVWYCLFYLAFLGLFGFQSAPTLEYEDGTAAQLPGTLYFIGSTFSTLGLGDVTPTAMPWTIIATLGALAVSSATALSLSYFIPVLSAVNRRRHFVIQVRSLGLDPTKIKSEIKTQGDANSLHQAVANLRSDMLEIALQANVYHVSGFFYFPTDEPGLSGSVLNLLDCLIVAQSWSDHESETLSRLEDSNQRSIQQYVRFTKRTEKIKREVDHSDLLKLLPESFNNTDRANPASGQNTPLASLLGTRASLVQAAHFEGWCPSQGSGPLRATNIPRSN